MIADIQSDVASKEIKGSLERAYGGLTKLVEYIPFIQSNKPSRLKFSKEKCEAIVSAYKDGLLGEAIVMDQESITERVKRLRGFLGL